MANHPDQHASRTNGASSAAAGQSAAAPSFRRTSAKAVADALGQGKQAPLLLDVREHNEFAMSHLANAQHLPLSEMPGNIADLRCGKDQPIVTYCHHGVRSLSAAAHLHAAGFTQVSSMDGGIDAWAVDVDASVGRY